MSKIGTDVTNKKSLIKTKVWELDKKKVEQITGKTGFIPEHHSNPNGEVKDRYSLFKQAERTGICPLCGWKDGDGVKICYYDEELGSLTHQNSLDAVLAKMSPSQQSLMRSYNSGKPVFLTAEALEEAIKKEEERTRKKISRLEEENAEDEREIAKIKTMEDIKRRGWTSKSVEDHHALLKRLINKRHNDILAYRKLLDIYAKDRTAVLDFSIEGADIKIKHRNTTLADAMKEGYIVCKPFSENQVWVQFPHTCGKCARYAGPYHITCEGCNKEVKLWEFGVDYDVG